jgi:hypothetical protein
MSDYEKKDVGELHPEADRRQREHSGSNTGEFATNKETLNPSESKLEHLGINDAGVIPKGTLDPVYEAKARVLNRAVSSSSYDVCARPDKSRFRISAWAGINGSCSSLLDSDGRMTTFGPSSPVSSVSWALFLLLNPADNLSHAHNQRVQPKQTTSPYLGTEHWTLGWCRVLGLRDRYVSSHCGSHFSGCLAILETGSNMWNRHFR